MHDMRGYWRNQGYSALHNQQDQFENAAQEHQRVTNEEVQTAAYLATSLTAAQMTFRFRHIENNAEAICSQQQTELLSEMTSESAQVLEVQRHTLVHEATAEVMRRDIRKEEVLSQLIHELQCNHHHAERQSEEFQQSQAEWRHNLGR